MWMHSALCGTDAVDRAGRGTRFSPLLTGRVGTLCCCVPCPLLSVDLAVLIPVVCIVRPTVPPLSSRLRPAGEQPCHTLLLAQCRREEGEARPRRGRGGGALGTEGRRLTIAD